MVADINGDGRPDIVMGEENGQLAAFSGADASMLPGFPIQLPAEVRGTPALCDCDGDGKTEIVVAGLDMNVYMWDYDFPFSPGQVPPWPQFHHDAARTGYAGTPVYGGDGGRDRGPAARARAGAARRRTRRGAARGSGTACRPTAPEACSSWRSTTSPAAACGSCRAAGPRRGGTPRPGTCATRRARRRAAGVYFARLSLGAEARSRKLVVVR